MYRFAPRSLCTAHVPLAIWGWRHCRYAARRRDDTCGQLTLWRVLRGMVGVFLSAVLLVQSCAGDE